MNEEQKYVYGGCSCKGTVRRKVLFVLKKMKKKKRKKNQEK